MAHTVVSRYGADGTLGRGELLRPPRCSLAYGGAGVAYFLMRFGALADDRRTTDTAVRWIARAQRDVDRADAFVVNGESRVLPDRRWPRPSPWSLYVGEAGVWCASALVSAAVEDADGVAYAVERFAAIADTCPPDKLDVFGGAAGLLLGACAVVERLGQEPPRRLLVAGQRLADRLQSVVVARLSSGVDPLGWLGAAHGWCGVAHAQLRWYQATGREPRAPLSELLTWLAAARQRSGLWPRRAASNTVWPGWCAGSAGWVQLWTLAFELLGDSALLELAARAGEHAVAGGGGSGLCCGLAGQGYAALALHRSLGDERWLAHARRIAAEAASTPTSDYFPAHSLWRGDLGAALLAAELSQPERAGMPLYRAVV